jgi:hypothetical protein
LKAIQTMYRGTQFRSKLEARWAEFFDLIGVVWQYEPEGYTNGKVCYLPDFWLDFVHSRGNPGGVFFEVKPKKATPDELAKALALAEGTGKTVILSVASPNMFSTEVLDEVQPDGTMDDGLQMARCDNCGQCDFGFYSGDEPNCPCGRSTFNPYNDALEAARGAFPNLARWEPKANG